MCGCVCSVWCGCVCNVWCGVGVQCRCSTCMIHTVCCTDVLYHCRSLMSMPMVSSHPPPPHTNQPPTVPLVKAYLYRAWDTVVNFKKVCLHLYLCYLQLPLPPYSHFRSLVVTSCYLTTCPIPTNAPTH